MEVRTVDDHKESIERSKTTPFLGLIIPVAKRLHSRIQELQDKLRGIDPSHVYHVPEYFHITVKPLGWLNEDVKERDLAAIFEILETELLSFNVFRIALTGLSCFPEVVYLKVHDPTESIRSLNKRLLERLGNMVVRYSYEGDNFVPHLTITTFKTKDVANLLRKLSELADVSAGSMHVSEISAVEFRPHLAYGKPAEQALAIHPLRSFALKLRTFTPL